MLCGKHVVDNLITATSCICAQDAHGTKLPPHKQQQTEACLGNPAIPSSADLTQSAVCNGSKGIGGQAVATRDGGSQNRQPPFGRYGIALRPFPCPLRGCAVIALWGSSKDLKARSRRESLERFVTCKLA